MTTVTAIYWGRSFQVGVKYALNPQTVVRAKVNSSGVVAACATNKVADKVSITVTGQVRETLVLQKTCDCPFF